jgi:hypothetical protein
LDVLKSNKPIASTKANPKMAYEKSCPRMDGLRATAMRRAAKTMPIPIPAPPRPMAAEPIPRFWETWTMAVAISEENGRTVWRPIMLRVVALRIWEAC